MRSTTRPRQAWTPGVRAAVFYGASTLALVLMVAKQLPVFLPDSAASQIGHNSEAVLFAALVCGTVQVLRRHRPPDAATWGGVAAFAVLCVSVAVMLRESTLPSSIATLNEPLVAAGVTALYLNLPRPVRWPLLWSAAVLALVIVFFDTTLVLDQAESLVPLVLAPICLDVVDRALLDPEQPWRPVRRLVWCGCLVALAALALVLARVVRPDLSGPVDLGIDYAQRAAEAYWGWLIVHVYLGFWLPWRLLGRGGGRRRLAVG